MSPSITIEEVAIGIENPSSSEAKKVLEAIINDYMDLQSGKETPYTTGKQILPTETTVEDIEGAAAKEFDKKYRDVYELILKTEKAGNMTPQDKNDGWDPKLTPVLVLVSPNRRLD